MIKITAKGLAKFMTAGESRKRTILRDFKHPDPEGFAQANYYHEAREAIRQFLKGETDLAGLNQRAVALRVDALGASGSTVTRLRSNARAIVQFAKNLPNLVCEVLDDVLLSLSHNGVRVSTSPDLHVRFRGRDTLLRFEFSRQPLPALIPRIMCQLMADACTVKGIPIAPKDCLYVDVARGALYSRAKARARSSKDIIAAMENIEAIWPTV